MTEKILYKGYKTKYYFAEFKSIIFQQHKTNMKKEKKSLQNSVLVFLKEEKRYLMLWEVGYF